ncbi:hypothetical protein DYB36_014223, partial [Aphanomyces astaci]
MHLLESAYRIEELLSDDDSDSDAEDKRTATTRASFGRNNNAKPSPPPPLPAVTLLLPPVSPVVLSARSSANATARRQHPQPSWEVPEPLTTT